MFALSNKNDNCISITDNSTKFIGRPEVSSYIDTNVSPQSRLPGRHEKALSGSPSTNAFGSDQTGRSQENTGTSSSKTHSKLILKSITGLAKKDARNAVDSSKSTLT